MNTRHLPGVWRLLTLVSISLALVACGRPAPAPQALPLVVTPQSNLLQNADFLDGVSGWQPLPAQRQASVVLGYDPAGFVTVAVGRSGTPQRAAWTQTVAVEPDAPYCISYRAHTEALVGVADLTLSFLDAAGRALFETSVAPVGGDSEWASYAWRCRAPAGAAQATVALGVEGTVAGRAAFDDVCLAPDDAPAVRALIVDYQQALGALHVGAPLAEVPLGPARAYTMARIAAGLSRAAVGMAPLPLAALGATPQRLLALGSDALGFTVLAGKSDDGRLVQILVADTGSRSEGYRLALPGFPPGYCYAITEAGAEAPLAQGEGAALLDGVLACTWRAPAVHLIRISWP